MIGFTNGGLPLTDDAPWSLGPTLQEAAKRTITAGVVEVLMEDSDLFRSKVIRPGNWRRVFCKVVGHTAPYDCQRCHMRRTIPLAVRSFVGHGYTYNRESTLPSIKEH